MATKTITIDVEAYRRLKSVKKEDESFSQVIKRAIRPPFDVEAFLKAAENVRLSPEAIKAVEAQIENRRRSRSRRR